MKESFEQPNVLEFDNTVKTLSEKFPDLSLDMCKLCLGIYTRLSTKSSCKDALVFFEQFQNKQELISLWFQNLDTETVQEEWKQITAK